MDILQNPERLKAFMTDLANVANVLANLTDEQMRVFQPPKDERTIAKERASEYYKQNKEKIAEKRKLQRQLKRNGGEGSSTTINSDGDGSISETKV